MIAVLAAAEGAERASGVGVLLTGAEEFGLVGARILAQTRPELVRGIEMANRAVYAAASTDGARFGMGTTLVAARFTPNKQRVYLAHVGDSRCYRLRDGALEQLTEDHTLEARGISGPAAAKLTRAVGVQADV